MADVALRSTNSQKNSCKICPQDVIWKIYCGCSFLSPVSPWQDFPRFSRWIYELFLEYFVIRFVCVGWVCGLTCAGSPCPPAVWGMWVEISCWPMRLPYPRSLSSSTPEWLNGWDVSHPDPLFRPARHTTQKDKTQTGLWYRCSV